MTVTLNAAPVRPQAAFNPVYASTPRSTGPSDNQRHPTVAVYWRSATQSSAMDSTKTTEETCLGSQMFGDNYFLHPTTITFFRSPGPEPCKFGDLAPPASMVTDAQVKLLRRWRLRGSSEELAAAAAGMTVPTARRWRSGPMPSHSKRPRSAPLLNRTSRGLALVEIQESTEPFPTHDSANFSIPGTRPGDEMVA